MTSQPRKIMSFLGVSEGLDNFFESVTAYFKGALSRILTYF